MNNDVIKKESFIFDVVKTYLENDDNGTMSRKWTI